METSMASVKVKKPKHPFWRGVVLPRLALMVAPFPRRTFCSIDVTSKCNLRCGHCYYFSHRQPDEPELTVDEWLLRIREMQKEKPFYNCTWVGGEPLLRKELIEKGRRYFRSNRIVTNGTIELPHWTDVVFHVSVDGTEEFHDLIRGKGSYAKIKKNLNSTNAQDLNIALACCINKDNANCIESLVAEWCDVPCVDHVLFDFFTPMRGSNNGIWLSFEERDRILDRLCALKEKFGDFIGGPPMTFELMRHANAHKSVGNNCIFVKHGVAFDAWGNRKYPCVMGRNADCVRCGCIVPFSVRAWKRPANLLGEIFKRCFR